MDARKIYPKEIGSIKVTVDKSHLLTLGEKMYLESVELLRELVSNAYDADATEVYINITQDAIVVEDNGSGMDEKGLVQYFNIGSPLKRKESVSPRFGRKRIGQFGIGKFAALAAADRFSVETRKGKWTYEVIFDKDDWEKKEDWRLPITKELATPFQHEGVKVTLSKLKKKFNLTEVEKYLRDSIPLRAKKFAVFLNNRKITPHYVAGKNISISFKTMYGNIIGEIIIAVEARLVPKPGVECRVKDVLIKRSLFDLENSHSMGLNRISGYVNADFLQVTASRNDFVRDNPEYRLFHQLMRKELEKILKDLKKESEKREIKKITKELREVLDKIRLALSLNPEIIPSGKAIARRAKRDSVLPAGSASKEVRSKYEISKEKPPEEAEEKKAEEKTPEEKTKLKNKAKPLVIRKIRIAKLGISCGVVHLGENGPETVSEGNLIYINQDHPLYQEMSKDKKALELHLLRLLTQEITMMKRLRLSARDAYDWQGKLLTDAICGKIEKK